MSGSGDRPGDDPDAESGDVDLRDDRSPGAAEGTSGGDLPSNPDIEHLLDHLEELEETVDDHDERAQVRRTMTLAQRIPGSSIVGEQINKYTTRDMAEAFVGSILISMPLLVEDGVFDIAAFFVSDPVYGTPVFLVVNAVFAVLLTIGLVYWVDIRDVRITRPIFGIVPRRLVGILTISFLTSAALMVSWGRLFEGDPTRVEQLARITVVWTAGSFGAALGDILPGESRGHDVTIENLDDIARRDD